jgi:hypothetical protein
MNKKQLDKEVKQLRKKLSRLFNSLSLSEYRKLQRQIEIAYQNELKKLDNNNSTQGGK